MSSPKEILKYLAASFEKVFTKEVLLRGYSPLAKNFITNHKALLIEHDMSANRLSTYLNSKNPTKAIITEAAAVPFISKPVYEAFLESLSPKVRKVWEYFVWEDETDELLLERKLQVKIYANIEVAKDARSYYYRPSAKRELLPEFACFQLSNDSQYYFNYSTASPCFVVGLPPFLRQWLKKYYPQPEDSKLKPVSAPEGARYIYDSGERDIALEWPRVAAYKEQGQIAYTSKNRPSLNTLPKMCKSLSIKEFFPDVEDKRAKHLRTLLLAGMTAWIKNNSSADSISKTLFDLFRGPYANQVITTPFVLPDLKGMGHLDDYYFHKKEINILNILASLPQGAWTPFRNVTRFVQYHMVDLQVLAPHVAANNLYYDYKKEEGWNNKHSVTKGQFNDAIVMSFLKGSFFLLAAFGLCDIAYNCPDWDQMGREYFSSWDGLKYVRRTPLGDYICEITKEYDASRLCSNAKISLSPDTLLIFTDENDVSAAGILAPYTERLGANRFRTDSRTFLNGIKSKKELTSKISLFKQIIGDELPPNWNAFFAELLHKIDPLKNVEDAKVLKIPQENKDLVRLVAQDAVLKSLVIKAEGFMIIVPKGNYAPLKRRLQEFGYLLTT